MTYWTPGWRLCAGEERPVLACPIRWKVLNQVVSGTPMACMNVPTVRVACLPQVRH